VNASSTDFELASSKEHELTATWELERASLADVEPFHAWAFIGEHSDS